MISLQPLADPTAQLLAVAPESSAAVPGRDASPPPPAPPTSVDHKAAGTDPEPLTAPVDPDGDTDPRASNTGDVHPL